VAVSPASSVVLVLMLPLPDAAAQDEPGEAVQVQVAPVSPAGIVSATEAVTVYVPLFVTTTV
jgi:hypothetical protein